MKAFRAEGHGLGKSFEGTIIGDSAGEVIDKAMEMYGLEFDWVRAMKIEVDGIVMHLIEVETPESKDATSSEG